MKIVNIKNNPEYLDSVIELGDINSKTLGFFPKDAFIDQARKGLILLATKDNSLLGYLMFRKSFDRINIVHLCINENARGQNIAVKLLDYLKSNTKSYRGIRLKCRNDYNINSFWEKANFTPVDEQVGRSKKGHLLTVWWYPHKHNDLFSSINENIAKDKIIAVIDTNIFIDLRKEREQESLALTSDWLIEEIELFITKEIFNDISRNPDKTIRDDCRSFTSRFKLLEFKEKEFSEIFEKIKGNFKLRRPRDKSDLIQIVNAVIGKADYFITRDQYWLDQSSFFEKNYDIIIKRPSVFITEIDELLEKTKYQPKRLAGTQITSEIISSNKIKELINTFHYNGHKQGRKSDFSKKLNLYLANPKDNEVITIIDTNHIILGFFVVDKSEKNKIRIPFLRTINHQLSSTLVNHFLYKIVQIATENSRILIQIEEKFLSNRIINILSESNFLKSNNYWIKFSINEVLSIDQLIIKLESFKSIFPEFLEDITSFLGRIQDSNVNKDSVSYYILEKLLYPLKITENDIPCFIIPIKREWATQLFEENLLGERLQFANDKPDLILNRKNVYYRSARPKRLESPSRILWYISKSKTDGAFIAGSSFLDHLEIDLPQPLFKKYEQLGIYEWKQIYSLANNNTEKEIMAFVFSDTELFKNKITLSQIRKLFKTRLKKEFNPISPISISNELFLKIYKDGM